MKGVINKDGHLHVWRKGALKKAECPRFTESSTPCGDWCALFGEIDGTVSATHNGYKRFYTLRLCSGTLRFEEFTDERE